MEKVKAASCEYFEYLLWQNELEYNRRELAIFESYLMNKGSRVQLDVYNDMMEQIHDLLRLINRLMVEINVLKKESSGEIKMEFQPKIEVNVAVDPKKKVAIHFFREEMFYYEQNYRTFKKKFCEFANRMEYA